MGGHSLLPSDRKTNDKNPILNESLAFFDTNSHHPHTAQAHYDERDAQLSPERRRAAFMEPPVSPRCQKLGPTSGIGLGNVFGVQRILRRTAGIPAKFVSFSPLQRRAAGSASRCRLLLPNSQNLGP